MRTCVGTYVNIVAFVQVLFTYVYKTGYVPLIGTNAEIHCSVLYVSGINRCAFLCMYVQCMDMFM